MKQQKIYSIIIGLVAYIIISHIFHVFFRGKTDVALRLLRISLQWYRCSGRLVPCGADAWYHL